MSERRNRHYMSAQRTGDAAGAQAVADGQGDVVLRADVQDLVPVRVREVLRVVQQAQLHRVTNMSDNTCNRVLILPHLWHTQEGHARQPDCTRAALPFSTKQRVPRSQQLAECQTSQRVQMLLSSTPITHSIFINDVHKPWIERSVCVGAPSHGWSRRVTQCR